jgi:hypothetical protein
VGDFVRHKAIVREHIIGRVELMDGRWFVNEILETGVGKKKGGSVWAIFTRGFEGNRRKH